ncbi:hypothetical protein LWF15_15415 [Kineosporia rhizophila]|uniref:hypothetical protein n=1 Tax=Kineosporia TaxID=49184 RepID=UPI001E330EEC|nr:MULTISPECIES: hypothetical protein [Kineosporia]MCE0536891.1 hypothetical protein [Kineosporia rhizophila]GLY19047.1 hypothetical protein Kisp01_60610 [Kineosporia sp. NBRC 101677]
MAIAEYPDEQVSAQPIGYWSRVAYQATVGRLRAELAVQQLTQPHWWTLNHVAGDPGKWTRTELAMRLQPFDDLGIELEDVFDDLIERDWLEESDGFRLTALGEQELAKARERMSGAQQDTRSGISTEDYVTTINTLRRMIGNLGGDSDLPGQ